MAWCITDTSIYVLEDEEWKGKSLFYRKIKYIFSNSERILKYIYNK